MFNTKELSISILLFRTSILQAMVLILNSNMNDVFHGSKEPRKQKLQVNFHISPGNNDRINANHEEIQAENPSSCHHDSLRAEKGAWHFVWADFGVFEPDFDETDAT